jgi:phage FluMu protein Com
MEIQKIAKVMTAVLILSFFALFFWFFSQMWMSDPFDDTDDIRDKMFLLFGLFFVLMIAIAAVNFIASRKGGTMTANTVMTKKCPSCGTVMDVTAHACPRCRTIQPLSFDDRSYSDRNADKKRKI